MPRGENMTWRSTAYVAEVNAKMRDLLRQKYVLNIEHNGANGKMMWQGPIKDKKHCRGANMEQKVSKWANTGQNT